MCSSFIIFDAHEIYAQVLLYLTLMNYMLRLYSGFFSPHWGQKFPVLPACPFEHVQVVSVSAVLSVSGAPLVLVVLP